MSRNDQLDLFGEAPRAAGRSDEGVAPVQYRADPAKVRARLQGLLAEARSAQTLPWKPAHVALYRTIFPQMTNWLPEEEAARLRAEFEAELTRLSAS